MNYIPKIAQMLGVELYEEFKIDTDEGVFRFNNEGLQQKKIDGFGETGSFILWFLIKGKSKIIKLPFVPKPKETYHYVLPMTDIICDTTNNLGTLDLLLIGNGFAFRTPLEAERNIDKATAFYKSVMDKVEVMEDE